MARIFLIELDQSTQHLIAVMLRALGHDPITLLPGSDLVCSSLAAVPHIVVLTISTTRLPVWDILVQLRSHRLLCSIPIVALVDDPILNHVERQRAYAAGCVACIGKPISYPHLMQLIAQHALHEDNVS